MKDILLLLLILIIQSTRFTFFSIQGVKPDLVLLFVCIISLREGSIHGTVFGFIGGIAQDFLSNGLLGAGAFGKSLWGYLIGKSGQRLDTGSLPVQIGLIFFFSICDALLIHFLTWAFHHPSFLKGRLVFYIFGQAVYNCIIWPFFAYILASFERLLRARR